MWAVVVFLLRPCELIQKRQMVKLLQNGMNPVAKRGSAKCAGRLALLPLLRCGTGRTTGAMHPLSILADLNLEFLWEKGVPTFTLATCSKGQVTDRAGSQRTWKSVGGLRPPSTPGFCA